MLAVRLVAAILALVLTLLGVAFLAVGLAGAGDEPEAFRLLGGVLLAVGLALAAFAAVLQAQERARARRRREGERGVATVVAARLHPYTRVGVLLRYTLTVRLPDGREATRDLLVEPTLRVEPGAELEVAYEPADPSNFEPLRAAGAPARV